MTRRGCLRSCQFTATAMQSSSLCRLCWVSWGWFLFCFTTLLIWRLIQTCAIDVHKSKSQYKSVPGNHHRRLASNSLQVSMSPWSCPAGGASLRTSPGRTAWQHWWVVMFVELTRPPGWPGELWCDTPTSLVCSSTALSAQPSTRGFPPWSIWCRQVRCGDETTKTYHMQHNHSQSCWLCLHYLKVQKELCEVMLLDQHGTGSDSANI